MTDPIIRFCHLAGGMRVAYSLHGSGPPLVCPAWWVSHMERDWKHPAFRDFFGQLAQHRTVVRYDRLGVGLSSRERHDFTQEAEVEVLAAIVDGLATPTVDLLAFSCAAPVALSWAAANPGRVGKLVFVGAYACGSDLGADAIRQPLVALVEAHWGMGAGAINRLFSPDLSGQELRALGRDQLASASAETAAKLLELTFALDARGAAAYITHPALVIHRQGDQTVRFDAGRDLAAELTDAMFLPVPGRAHLPWLGETEPILSAIGAFLDGVPRAQGALLSPAGREGPLSEPSWMRVGDTWSICFAGRSIHLRHAKGLADLCLLLDRPGKSVEALELYAGADAPRLPAVEPVVDREALLAYRSRLTELADELEQAETRGDVGRSERIQGEKQGLLAHLSQITGLGGRVRKANPVAERARKAVSARIRDTISKLGSHHPELGAHLQAAVSTGSTCSYEPAQPVIWSVSRG